MCLIVFSELPACLGRAQAPAEPLYTAFCKNQLIEQFAMLKERDAQGRGPLKKRHFLPCADFMEVSVEHIDLENVGQDGNPVVKAHACRHLLTETENEKIANLHAVYSLEADNDADISESDDVEGDDFEGDDFEGEDVEDEGDTRPPSAEPAVGARVLSPHAWTADEDAKLLALHSQRPKLGSGEVGRQMAPRTKSACTSRLYRLTKRGDEYLE